MDIIKEENIITQKKYKAQYDYYLRNRELIKEKFKEYYLNHIEERKEYSKKFYEENKERYKQYYQNNKEKIRQNYIKKRDEDVDHINDKKRYKKTYY